MDQRLDIVILGLSITSSWGNGHATTFRSLVRALDKRGHRVFFLERDVPWYAGNRDLPSPPYGRTELYSDLEELYDEYAEPVRSADLVIVGSFVPEGVAVSEWVCHTATGVKAFYDIDTPVTLSKLQRRDFEYLHPALVPHFDLYLSFTGGPVLKQLQDQYHSPMARPLYCSADPDLYRPMETEVEYTLGYMGTYSDDRQPTLERLLLEPARQMPDKRFAVAGPCFPESIRWPDNVQRLEHLAPSEHCQFYNQQQMTLNVTRADMIKAGYAPSVRLFEAAACGTAIISDQWPGLGEFFKIGEELLIADSTDDVLQLLRMPEERRRAISGRARGRVLSQHTAVHRVLELESYLNEVAAVRSC